MLSLFRSKRVLIRRALISEPVALCGLTENWLHILTPPPMSVTLCRAGKSRRCLASQMATALTEAKTKWVIDSAFLRAGSPNGPEDSYLSLKGNLHCPLSTATRRSHYSAPTAEAARATSRVHYSRSAVQREADNCSVRRDKLTRLKRVVKTEKSC